MPITSPMVSADGYYGKSGTANVTAGGSVYNVTLQAPKASGTCGETLYWMLSDSGVLTIYGEGDM